ncbi:MAG: signal peptidase I [Lachnospiraceae bacterium]|nr:signal peptidase I [Lachnospiraceae bacterium]
MVGCFIIAYLCAFLITSYVVQLDYVMGTSMENTLMNKDCLVVNKFVYHFSSPDRFDIVIFPHETDTYYIKRIIGLPGETVQIKEDGTIWIDGELLEENYGKEPILNPGNAIEPLELGDNEYFVLGDNRNESSDSRFDSVGMVHQRDILGKVVARVFPFQRMQTID